MRAIRALVVVLHERRRCEVVPIEDTRYDSHDDASQSLQQTQERVHQFEKLRALCSGGV